MRGSRGLGVRMRWDLKGYKLSASLFWKLEA